LTLLAALLTAAPLLAALLTALASGLLLLLAGLLLTALLTPLLTALLLPALLHVAHFVVRHGGTLLRGRIPRDDKLFAPPLVPQQTSNKQPVGAAMPEQRLEPAVSSNHGMRISVTHSTPAK
jgi:hypothetical protein